MEKFSWYHMYTRQGMQTTLSVEVEQLVKSGALELQLNSECVTHTSGGVYLQLYTLPPSYCTSLL